MIKRARGFTMIEVLVVVAIIGILATITFMGFGRYQANARDNSRLGKATILSEALEKYYDKNGEYPGCLSIAAPASAATVTTSVLPGIDTDALVAPQADSGTTNSVACADLTDISQADFFAYVGDGSATCSSGQACLSWTLKYKEESTGLVKSITSRRTTSIATAGDTTLTSTGISFTQINLNWTAVDNALSYTIQRATNDIFTVNMVPSTSATTTASATGLTAGTLYYFRVMPQASGSAGNWSNTASTTTWATPAAPVIAVTLSSANVLATISPVTCHAGTTAQYGIRSHTNGGAWGAYSAWSTATTASQVAAQGVKYGYQAQARCYSVASTSPTSEGIEDTYIHPVAAPAAPTITASTPSTSTTYTWSAVACPAGATARYQYRYVIDYTGGYTSAWYGPTASLSSVYGTSYEGYSYTAQVQAQCYNANTVSAWSATGQANYIRPVQAPGAISYGIYRGASADIAYVSATSSCQSSYASLYSRADMHTWDYVWLDTQANGWWANSHNGVWMANSWAYYGNPVAIYARNQSGPFATGSRWNIAVEFRCQNSSTGRTSASTGRVESAILLLP